MLVVGTTGLDEKLLKWEKTFFVYFTYENYFSLNW